MIMIILITITLRILLIIVIMIIVVVVVVLVLVLGHQVGDQDQLLQDRARGPEHNTNIDNTNNTNIVICYTII